MCRTKRRCSVPWRRHATSHWAPRSCKLQVGPLSRLFCRCKNTHHVREKKRKGRRGGENADVRRRPSSAVHTSPHSPPFPSPSPFILKTLSQYHGPSPPFPLPPRLWMNACLCVCEKSSSLNPPTPFSFILFFPHAFGFSLQNSGNGPAYFPFTDFGVPASRLDDPRRHRTRIQTAAR